jgi:hypothetical protein
MHPSSVIIRTAERGNADYHSVIVRHIRLRRMNPKNVKIALAKRHRRMSIRIFRYDRQQMLGGSR